MKITCKRKDLVDGLSIVDHAIATKSTLPILGYIKLETTESGLRLTANNLELAIQCLVEATIEGSGSTTLPAKKFTTYIALLPFDDLVIETPENTLVTTITSEGNSSATMQGMDVSEFPAFPELDSTTSLSLETHLLKELVKSVGFAAGSSDNDKPTLSGIYLEVANQRISCAAADGFHLALQDIPLAQEMDPLKMLVPARALRDIAAILPDQGQVTVGVTTIRNQAVFLTPTVIVCSRLLVGDYVPFRSIVPADYKLRAVVSANVFHAVIKAATLFALEGEGTITLTLQSQEDKQVVVVKASAPDLGTSSCQVPAVFDGSEQEPLTIIFQATYLNNVCTAVGNIPELAIELRRADAPGVFKPIGEKQVTYLIMPKHRK